MEVARNPAPRRRPIVVAVALAEPLGAELRGILEAHDIEVRMGAEPAEGGQEAPPDVVVVEVERARPTDSARWGAPVLATVRRDSPEEVRRALHAGAVDVLPLPFDESEVIARVGLTARLWKGEALLQARNAELGAWAKRAGHDLRTPLAVISGMAETLEAAWERLSADDRARMLASIRNQAARATAMVDEAVALAAQAPPPEPPSPSP